MTDKEFLLRVLSDGQPHTLQEILRRSFHERGHGLTVHSRAADLRADGHDVRVTPGNRGGVYQIVCPAGARYGRGLSETTVHAGGCCETHAEQLALDAPAVRKAPAWA